MPMKRATGLGLLLLISCSDSNGSSPDAPLGSGDASVRGDASVVDAPIASDAPVGPDGAVTVDAATLGDADTSSPFNVNHCHMELMGDEASGVTAQTFDITGLTGDSTRSFLAFAAFNADPRAMDTEIGCDQSTFAATDPDAGPRVVFTDVGFLLGLTGHLTDLTFPFHFTQASAEVHSLTVQYLPSQGTGWGCSSFDGTI